MKKALLATIYGLVVIGTSAGAVLYLSSQKVVGAFEGLANKTITFCLAAAMILLLEALYDWKHKVKTSVAYGTIGSDPRGLGMCLGLRCLGLSILGAAIFGAL